MFCGCLYTVPVIVPTTTQEYESARESWEVREGELEQQLEDTKKEITSKPNVPLKKVSAINVNVKCT